MPKSEEHLIQADHNYELLSFFSSNTKDEYFSDWYVTVCFYCALHYVEAFLYLHPELNVADIGIKTVEHSSGAKPLYNVNSSHLARKNLIRDNPEFFGKIQDDYNTLYEMSRVARYNCEGPKNHDYVDAGQRLEVIKEWLPSVTP